MSAKTDRAFKDIANAIREGSRQKTKSYDTQATVTRVEGDTAWVHVPGGVVETPVRKTINCRPGDNVQVRVSNGRAWLQGNMTAPPTDDRAASEAKKQAGEAYYVAEEARNSIAAAYEAAERAEAEAGRASTAASAATQSADAASRSAESALGSANAALMQLSVVEDVVGVVEWMEENCSYRLTQDQTVQSGKFYYTRSGTSPNYVYTEVANPVDADIASYYEKYISGDTIRDFITSHISVSSQGMYLQTDGVGSKLLLSPENGVVHFGPNGDPVAKYGEDVQIGSDKGYNIRITTSGEVPMLSFNYGIGTDPIAYISQDMLYIPKSVVIDSMQVGDAEATGMGWRWVINQTDDNLLGNLTLTWIGE